MKAAGFPKWAPAEAIAFEADYRANLRHFAEGDPRRDCPDMLRRLLLDESMARVWGALRLSKKLFPIQVFAASAAYGFCGPRGEARFTPAQHRAFLADVRKQSANLAKLLRGTELDLALVVRLDLICRDAGHLCWPTFSEILEHVDSVTQFHATPSAGKRTHGEDARRAYFVRYLTGFFMEYLGGPRRELVTITTCAAFNDPSFTVRSVQRLAPQG